MALVGFCPSCGDEFRADVTVCSDCGVALSLQEEGLGSGAHPPAEDWRTALDDLPVSGLIPAGVFGALEELEPGVTALADVHLPSRVLVQNGRFLLLVRPTDLGAAQEAIQGSVEEAGAPPDPAFDSVAGKYSACPACGTDFPGGFDGVCPDCGLELSGNPSGAIPEPE